MEIDLRSGYRHRDATLREQEGARTNRVLPIRDLLRRPKLIEHRGNRFVPFARQFLKIPGR